jgi:tetratricopeptide (TPR) repeat protein
MSMILKERHITAVDMPHVRQSLKLVCQKCGVKQLYDVGTIFLSDAGNNNERFQFTNYFRCSHCDSPGPFEVADYLKIIGEIMAGKVRKNPKVFSGRAQLFDGTAHQTLAMSEEYLKGVIAKDPDNAFLHVRLGNLQRAGRRESIAIECYERAVGLDPHELEALTSLEELSIKREDYRSALRHAWAILNAIEAGRRAETDELTRGILSASLYLMNEHDDDFRAAWDGETEDFRDSKSGQILHEFMEMGSGLDKRVQLFVNTALGEDLDKEEFEDDDDFALSEELGADKDLGPRWKDQKLRPVEMEASLAAVVTSASLDWKGLNLDLPAQEGGGVTITSRNRISLTDGERCGLWTVPSLRALFRGNRQAPQESEMEQYPAEYVDLFYCVEFFASMILDADRDPTDDEFIELYSTMRRRPDGKGLGVLHDVVWQSACLALGMVKYSESEYGAVFGQLTRSVRHYRTGPSSRNYISYLRLNFNR